MTLLTLYYLLKKKYSMSAFWYGLVVHFKIYPILYALPIYFFIENEKKTFFTKNRIAFKLRSNQWGSPFSLQVVWFSCQPLYNERGAFWGKYNAGRRSGRK